MEQWNNTADGCKNKMYLERYAKGSKKVDFTTDDKKFILKDLHDYFMRYTIYKTVRASSVYHYNDTYTLTFIDKSNGCKTKFYNVPRHIDL